jgi:hypothetical protein
MTMNELISLTKMINTGYFIPAMIHLFEYISLPCNIWCKCCRQNIKAYMFCVLHCWYEVRWYFNVFLNILFFDLVISEFPPSWSQFQYRIKNFVSWWDIKKLWNVRWHYRGASDSLNIFTTLHPCSTGSAWLPV